MQLALARVTVAASAIPSAFVGAPQYRSEALSRLLGVELILQIETVNPAGTVAGRSAEWWFECNPGVHRVVCASAGDFGLAMSHAGRRRGVEIDIFSPDGTDPAKAELRHAGTTLVVDEPGAEDMRAEAARYASMVDALFVEDGTRVEFIEGAATMAAEFEELADPVDVVFVPIGRGTLAVGTAAWCRQRMPRARVIGVGTENAPGPVRSARAGRVMPSPVVGTATPEMGLSAPAEELVAALGEGLDDTALVTDRQLDQAAAARLAQEGIRASLDGAAGLAAAAMAAPTMRGATVVVPVTGRSLG